jgi:hypothetical protein
LFEAGADLFCKDNVRGRTAREIFIRLSLTLSTVEFWSPYRLLRRRRLRCTDADIDGLRLLLSDLSDSLLSRLPSSLLCPLSCQHYQQHRKPWLSFYHSVHHAEKDQRPSTESQEGQNHPPSEGPSSVRTRAACSSLRRLVEISDVIRFVTEYM